MRIFIHETRLTITCIMVGIGIALSMTWLADQVVSHEQRIAMSSKAQWE